MTKVHSINYTADRTTNIILWCTVQMKLVLCEKKTKNKRKFKHSMVSIHVGIDWGSRPTKFVQTIVQTNLIDYLNHTGGFNQPRMLVDYKIVISWDDLQAVLSFRRSQPTRSAGVWTATGLNRSTLSYSSFIALKQAQNTITCKNNFKY